MEEAKKLKDADKVFDIPISYVERGKKIGRQIVRNEVALKMIETGLDDDLIMEMTGLNQVEFEKLKEN